MKKLICAILALMLLVSSVITVSAAESTATITTKNSNVGYSARRIGDDTVYNTIVESVLNEDGTIKNDSYTSDANGGIVNMKALNSGADIDNFDINTAALNNKYFYITDAVGMIVFSKVVALGDSVKVSENEYCFKDKVVYLVSDIDFTGWSDKMKPIGENGQHCGFAGNAYVTSDYGTQPHDIRSAREFFSGTFDGRGHKISNLDMTAPYLGTYKSGNPVALFKVLRGDATIQNLVIDNTCSFINEASASTASGVKTAGNGQGNATASLAAFVFADNSANYGYGDSKSINITNVASYASVNGGTSTNSGNALYRYDVAGGLVAFLNINMGATYGADIQYCTFSGEITSAGSTAGGIVGVVHTGRVYATVADCLNTANISAGINAGGIVGSNWDVSTTTAQKLYIRRSINTAKISATNAGAILGYCGKAAELHVVNCFNNGAVEKIYNYNTTVGQIATFNDTGNFNINETDNTAVSYLGAQKTELTGNSRSIRLVGTITATKADLSKYKAIGFVISATYAGGQVLTVEDTVVYKSMLLQGGDGELDSEYSTLTDGFYFAAVLKDLSAELGEVTFRVTPYFIDADETITYGKTGYNVVNIATGEVK